jgi:predicted RNase H-like nuclease (RuvC/YqgF family)
MKKKKRLILGLGICFILIVCIQIFSSGHTHVVVVEENVSLTKENKGLKSENRGLKKSVSELKAENKELATTSGNMKSLVGQIVGQLDSTNSVVKKIKTELNNEKSINRINNGGREFEFQPIKLPDSEGN